MDWQTTYAITALLLRPCRHQSGRQSCPQALSPRALLRQRLGTINHCCAGGGGGSPAAKLVAHAPCLCCSDVPAAATKKLTSRDKAKDTNRTRGIVEFCCGEGSRTGQKRFRGRYKVIRVTEEHDARTRNGIRFHVRCYRLHQWSGVSLGFSPLRRRFSAQLDEPSPR